MLVESKGLILKVFPYSNTSVICNIFTNNFGKLTLMVKGVRKPKKPLLSIIQPFNLVEVQYYYKKNRGIQLVKEADIIISFDKLRTNSNSILFGSIILGIINKVFEKEYPNEIIFRLICKTLNQLRKDNNKNKIMFLFFLYHLNKQLGFMPTIKNNSELSDSSKFFLNDINKKTHINDIFNINVMDDNLLESYYFIIHFMKIHINYMTNLKGLEKNRKNLQCMKMR